LAIYKKSTADDYAQLLGATLDTYSHYLPSMGGDQTAKADRKGRPQRRWRTRCPEDSSPCQTSVCE
jgi:hypothetical protein